MDNSFDSKKQATLNTVERRFGAEARSTFEKALEKTGRIPEWVGHLSTCSLRDFISGVQTVIFADALGVAITGLMPDPAFDPAPRDGSLGEVTGSTKYYSNGVLFTKQSEDTVASSYQKRAAAITESDKGRWTITILEYQEGSGIVLLATEFSDKLSEALLCAATKMTSN